MDYREGFKQFMMLIAFLELTFVAGNISFILLNLMNLRMSKVKHEIK